MKTIVVLAAILAVAGFGAGADAASKKPDVRSTMTEEQKKELRRRGLEWCRKNLVHGGGWVVRVEITRDGGVRCWYKS
jgi:hypothetical protein